MRILRQVVGVQSSCFSISLKICLVISFVFSLHASISYARNPLQSLALPFFSRLSIAACTSFLRTPESHLSCPRSLVFSICCSFHLCSDHTLHCHLTLRRATCCGTLRRRWQFLSEMSPFLLFHSSFWGWVSFSLRIWSEICCWFHWTSQGSAVSPLSFSLLFLVLMHFLILLLTSFSCCLSSLAMVLLSLMSLLISSSLLSVSLLRLPVAPSFVHPSAWVFFFAVSASFCSFAATAASACASDAAASPSAPPSAFALACAASFPFCFCAAAAVSVLSFLDTAFKFIISLVDRISFLTLFFSIVFGSCCTHSFLSSYLQSDYSKFSFVQRFDHKRRHHTSSCFMSPFGVMYVACFSVVFLYIVLTAQTSVASPIASSDLLSCFRHWEYISKHCFAQAQCQDLTQRWSLRPRFECTSLIWCVSRLLCMSFQRGDLRIPSGSVHTHQQYRLIVDGYWHCNSTLADVVCPIGLIIPSLVQQFPNSVFVWESPSSHVCMALECHP